MSNTEFQKTSKHRPKKLKLTNLAGTGLEIHADIQFNPNCVEFVMKKGYQPIMNGAQHETNKVISYEPWIQFPDKDWDEMLECVFQEMVDLWNEKYATSDGTFTFFWLDGSREVLKGETPTDALNKAGYGRGAIKALDFYGYGDDNSVVWNKAEKAWKKKQ